LDPDPDSQRYGYVDPDPDADPQQNFTDPQHWVQVIWTAGSGSGMQPFFVSHYDTGEKEMPAHGILAVDRNRSVYQVY
jgi:hypothetical protein